MDSLLKLGSWIGLSALVSSTIFILRSTKIIVDAIETGFGYKILDISLLSGISLTLCLGTLLSHLPVPACIFRGISPFLAFCSIYYSIGIVTASSQCLVGCVLLAGSACSKIIIFVDSASSNISGNSNIITSLENDDDTTVPNAELSSVFIQEVQATLDTELNEALNATGQVFDTLEEWCFSVSAAATPCRYALYLSLIASGGLILSLVINLRRREQKGQPSMCLKPSLTPPVQFSSV